jgi:cyclically-permuted mutarotase family protein
MTLLAPLPIGANDSVQGVSAPFAGMLDGRIVVCGGCNFPGKPAAEGGAKVYYDDIVVYDASRDTWKLVGHLPKPLAYGGSVVKDGELYIIGGNNNDGASASVYSVKLEKKLFGGYRCTVTERPSLPEPMDNFGFALYNDAAYVVGGNQSGAPANRVYASSLGDAAWSRKPDFPGAARVQPAVVGVNGEISATFFQGLLLMGGYQPGIVEEGSDIPTAAQAPAEVLVLHEKGWLTFGEIVSTDDEGAIAAAGSFVTPIGDGRSFVIGGGVNHNIFLRALDNARLTAEARLAGDTAEVRLLEEEKAAYLTHPAAWYRFESEPYYFVGDRLWNFIPMGSLPQTARAGAAALYDDGWLYVIGGELKPGIRTAEVSRTWVDLREPPMTFMGRIVEPSEN